MDSAGWGQMGCRSYRRLLLCVNQRHFDPGLSFFSPVKLKAGCSFTGDGTPDKSFCELYIFRFS
eukprot:6202841-Pleurochrysis_carterae.AAC.1